MVQVLAWAYTEESDQPAHPLIGTLASHRSSAWRRLRFDCADAQAHLGRL